MSEVLRFGVSIDVDLLESFDRQIAEQGYQNRSEAIRDLMRDSLVKAKLGDSNQVGEVIGNLTIVYDHHANDLKDKMSDMQHEFYYLIVSVLHVHLSHDDCMEVLVLKGDAKNISLLAESLLSLKGVKHGKLFVTLPAQKIVQT